jgi:hypothetical protein
MERTPSPYYGALIKKATGLTDNTETAEVEDIMRCEYSTLDHLTRQKFNRLAKRAYAVWLEMKSSPAS